MTLNEAKEVIDFLNAIELLNRIYLNAVYLLD